jgi:hypothetical protein
VGGNGKDVAELKLEAEDGRSELKNNKKCE